MDQITPSLFALLDLFSPCFRFEVAATFRLMVVAWIVCLKEKVERKGVRNLFGSKRFLTPFLAGGGRQGEK